MFAIICLEHLLGLIKKYRKQYFQVDTLVNKRNTIVEIISQCHRNGARFLEQKQSASSKSSSESSKDMIWTVLTKERTFRKVSLAIQYRQRCNASSKAATDAAAVGTVSPTNPSTRTTVPSVSPAKVSPTRTVHKSSRENGSSPNVVQSYMDHHSNHNDNHQSLMYGYHHPSMTPTSTIPPNRVLSTANSGYGYSHSSYVTQPPSTSTTSPSDVEKKSQTQHPSTFVMSNGIVISNSNKIDTMKPTTDEFMSCYDDAIHWTNSSHGNGNSGTTSAPWSLPFLSNAMSALPPFQSSIFLRQRDDHLNLSHHSQQHQHHHRQYSHHSTNSPQRNGNAKMMMPQQQGRHNMDAMLYAPATRPHQESFIYRDNGKDCDDSDPIPISDIFGMPTSNQQHGSSSSWDEPNVPRYNHNTHTIRSSSIVSPQQPYNNCILPPPQEQEQHRASFIRRVSNFKENDHGPQHHNQKHHSSDRHNKSNGNDEIVSTTDSITTIETSAMKEFHQITMDTSDTLTTVAAETTSLLSSVGESGIKNTIVISSDDEDNDTEGRLKNAISDTTICNGVSISDSSTCSHSDDTMGSILYNDLCLSPLSFSTSTSPEPYHDHFISDSDDMMYNHINHNEVQILQLPFL